MASDPLAILNPWEVSNIQEFVYINCPECEFKTKIETSFESHAVENHTRSHALFKTLHVISNFMPVNVKEETVVDCNIIFKEEPLDFIPETVEAVTNVKKQVIYTWLYGR